MVESAFQSLRVVSGQEDEPPSAYYLSNRVKHEIPHGPACINGEPEDVDTPRMERDTKETPDTRPAALDLSSIAYLI